MEVILLERIAKLGQMGDVVRVRDGYARNFLLPGGKALRATKENRAKFETMKTQLEARNLGLKSEADKIGQKLDGQVFVVLRQASDTGQLYGSVTARDLAAVIGEGGFTVNRSQIALNTPIKTIGLHKVPIALHPDVEVAVTVSVARNAEEAERIARGEDVTARREEAEEPAELAAEDFFEPEAVPQPAPEEEPQSGRVMAGAAGPEPGPR
jgi:large subunit ribosomal protein L9